MNLLWLEISFNKVEQKMRRAKDLQNEIQKMHRILDSIEGIKLYSGNYWKGFGQKYFLTVPDNSIGSNLLQYFKQKNYSL